MAMPKWVQSQTISYCYCYVLFEPDNENVNTGADGYVHAFKAVAWNAQRSKILGCGICIIQCRWCNNDGLTNKSKFETSNQQLKANMHNE